MKTLESGDCVRAANFSKAFPVMTIAVYAIASGLDIVAERNRAIARGHLIAWTINTGSMISDSREFNDSQIAERAERRWNAITLTHGEIVSIDGDSFTVRVNGEQFADPITFKLV